MRAGSEIDYPPYCFVDATGAPTGFSVELLDAALTAMDREVTFRVGPWADVRGWLESGQVDALPLVGRTPEREALYDFTFPYLSVYGAIVVRDGETGITEMEDLRGRQVAVMRGDNAEEYLRREDRGVDIVTTATFDEALRGLSEGSYDAVVIQRLVALRLIQENGLTGLRVLNRPLEDFRQDFCFAVRDGDSDTLALLNEGLASVIADGTFDRLQAKWFAAFELPSERRIIVGGDHDYPPYEYLDENGRPAGYNVELTQAIAREVGLDVEIRLGSWEEMRAALENGEVDVLQGMFYSVERDLTFDFSQPHLTTNGVAVVRAGEGDAPATLDDLRDKRIVVQRGDIMQDYASRNGLESNVSAVGSPEEALRLLAEGEYDCALIQRVTALYLIDEEGLTDLVVGKSSLLSSEYCYAVAGGRTALLADFSEGLKALKDNGEYRRIYEEWMGVYEEASVDVRTILLYVALGVVPLLVILGAVLLWSRSLRRQVDRRTRDLRSSEEQYRLLADNSLDAIWTMGVDLQFTYINPASIDITGFEPEEWIGSNLRDHCDEANFAKMVEIISAEVAEGPSGRGVIFEAEMLRKDGEPIPVEIHGKVVFGDDGQPTSIQGVTRDIVERKRTEEVLRERDEQLLQSQKMEAVGQLAGGIAHDFNNLLTAVIGYSDLLMARDELAHSSALDDAREIRLAAERASALTKQILAFSRRQALRPSVVSLNDVLAGMEPLLRRTLGERIDLVSLTYAGLGRVEVDMHQFEQVLMNLALNARDAMPEGGRLTMETANVELDDEYCSTHPGVQPGDYVMLAVSDDGVGMDEATSERAFEPFFTTKAPGEGTGLGLATVYGIVKQSNGNISVYSEPGRGTTFKIYLPRVVAKDVATMSAAVENTGGAGHEVVMVVEDESALRSLIERVLGGAGYDVVSFGSADEAKVALEDDPNAIDLLLTDVVLPGTLQGKDLVEEALALRPDLPVLYMSGYTRNAIVHAGRLDEGVNFIEKPFTPVILVRTVRQVLDQV